MGRILVGHGGCGSASLIRRMWDHGMACHGRPDIAFYPHDTPALSKSARRGMQILSERGYEDFPDAGARAMFHTRTGGFCMDPSKTIFDNMAAYLDAIDGGNAHTWLCRAPLFGLFQRLGVRTHRPVFILRHPLHQFVSFTQPYRHADWAGEGSQRFSDGAIERFARAWNAFAIESQACDAIVLRYEFARQDAKNAGDEFLCWLVEELTSPRFYHGAMPASSEAMLRDLTGAHWPALYEAWDLGEVSA